MYRTVGSATKWALRQVLEQKFKDTMDKLFIEDKFFHHDFSKAKPFYELGLRVNLEEFNMVVMEKEIADLRKRLERRDKETMSRILKSEPDDRPQVRIDDSGK
jgi:hypothetical protein